MESGHAARVLLVDDHPIVRMGVRRLLEAEPGLVVCGEAESVDGALQAVRTLTPDLVITDLSLDGTSAVELIRRLVSLDPGLLVLVYSVYEESAFAEVVFAAGARGYVTKQERPEVLLRAIRQLLDGGIYLSRPPAET